MLPLQKKIANSKSLKKIQKSERKSERHRERREKNVVGFFFYKRAKIWGLIYKTAEDPY